MRKVPPDFDSCKSQVRVASGRNQGKIEPKAIATGSAKAVRENLRLSPNGTKIEELIQGAELGVLQDRGA